MHSHFIYRHLIVIYCLKHIYCVYGTEYPNALSVSGNKVSVCACIELRNALSVSGIKVCVCA